MPTAIILTALCASIFGVFYMFFTTRNRERMAMIEKHGDVASFAAPRLRQASPNSTRGFASKFSLKAGFFLAGLGLGFVISVLFYGTIPAETYPLLVVGIVFVTGGVGLIGGYLVGRKLDDKKV